MAEGTKISALPSAAALTGDEEVPLVQGSDTKRTTTQDIADLASVVGVVGEATGQLLAWDDTAQEWVAVTPNTVTAADISASSTGYSNSTGTTIQDILDDFDSAITTGGGGGGGGGDGSVDVLDTFTRADSATSLGNAESGQTWTVQGTWGIASNQALKESTAGTGQVAYIDSGAADCTVDVDVKAGSGASYTGACFRMADVSNGLIVRLETSEDKVHLFKRTGGTDTGIASFSTTVNSGTTYHLKIVMGGAGIVIFLNGAQVINYSTTTGYEANTKHGLYALDGSASAHRFDNFSVTT